MKNLIALLALTVFVGCTDKSPVETNVVGLKAELREAQYSLAACQNKLLNGHSGTIDDPIKIDEPSAPAEPEYEEVSRYDIETKMGKTSCYVRNNNDEGEELSCGMTFHDCKDGYIYRCMQDVKYKIVKEQKLIEQE